MIWCPYKATQGLPAHRTNSNFGQLMGGFFPRLRHSGRGGQYAYEFPYLAHCGVNYWVRPIVEFGKQESDDDNHWCDDIINGSSILLRVYDLWALEPNGRPILFIDFSLSDESPAHRTDYQRQRLRLVGKVSIATAQVNNVFTPAGQCFVRDLRGSNSLWKFSLEIEIRKPIFLHWNFTTMNVMDYPSARPSASPREV